LTQGFVNRHRFFDLEGIIAALNSMYVEQADICLVLSAIARMAQFMNDSPRNAPFWRDMWFMSLKFMPIFQQLLSLPRDDLDQLHLEPGVVIREATRLTCIILLGIMNKKFHIDPDGIAIHKNRVMKLLSNTSTDWFPFMKLRLWILVITGLVEEGRERAWHVGEISKAMKQLDLNTWNEALLTVKEIIWVDELLDDEAHKLESEVQQTHISS
jgi:hypothetical protein